MEVRYAWKSAEYRQRPATDHCSINLDFHPSARTDRNGTKILFDFLSRDREGREYRWKDKVFVGEVLVPF